MTQRLTPGTALLLTIPPLLWAGNAVVGRMVQGLIPPITLNFLRWVLAFAILLPLAGWVLRPSSGLWPHWRRFTLLGLLGVGGYNALQYLALQTSTPLNVTLVASSIPLWMLATGALFFGVKVTRGTTCGCRAVHGRRAGGALARELGTTAAAAAGHRRPVHAAGHRGLGLVQLAADAPRRACPKSALTGPPS